MIPKEILQAHYKEYASQSDAWVRNMAVTKRSIMRYVLASTELQSPIQSAILPVRIAVLGASDKRYIPIHERIFSDLLHRNVQVTTFDIDLEHLAGSPGAMEHDVTRPFPNPPYKIVFSHELMKFLTPEEQLQAMKNSYGALAYTGLAMHIMHAPSIKGTSELRAWQYRVNPDVLLEQLQRDGIPSKKVVFESESEVSWLRETTVIVIQKFCLA